MVKKPCWMFVLVLTLMTELTFVTGATPLSRRGSKRCATSGPGKARESTRRRRGSQPADGSGNTTILKGPYGSTRYQLVGPELQVVCAQHPDVEFTPASIGGIAKLRKQIGDHLDVHRNLGRLQKPCGMPHIPAIILPDNANLIEQAVARISASSELIRSVLEESNMTHREDPAGGTKRRAPARQQKKNTKRSSPRKMADAGGNSPQTSAQLPRSTTPALFNPQIPIDSTNNFRQLPEILGTVREQEEWTDPKWIEELRLWAVTDDPGAFDNLSIQPLDYGGPYAEDYDDMDTF